MAGSRKVRPRPPSRDVTVFYPASQRSTTLSGMPGSSSGGSSLGIELGLRAILHICPRLPLSKERCHVPTQLLKLMANPVNCRNKRCAQCGCAAQWVCGSVTSCALKDNSAPHGDGSFREREWRSPICPEQLTSGIVRLRDRPPLQALGGNGVRSQQPILSSLADRSPVITPLIYQKTAQPSCHRRTERLLFEVSCPDNPGKTKKLRREEKLNGECGIPGVSLFDSGHHALVIPGTATG